MEGGERTKRLKEVRVRVQSSRSKGLTHIHTKGIEVQVLVGGEAILFHGCKSETNCSRGAGRGSGEVASELKPAAHNR